MIVIHYNSIELRFHIVRTCLVDLVLWLIIYLTVITLGIIPLTVGNGVGYCARRAAHDKPSFAFVGIELPAWSYGWQLILLLCS